MLSKRILPWTLPPWGSLTKIANGSPHIRGANDRRTTYGSTVATEILFYWEKNKKSRWKLIVTPINHQTEEMPGENKEN